MTQGQTQRRQLQQLDLYLIKVLHTLLREQSVTRTALMLDTSQPAISEALRRMRAITGDQLFVRSGQKMMATDFADGLREPTETILRTAERAFLTPRQFDPVSSQVTFRVAAPDYLDPAFVPGIIQRARQFAPGVRIDVRALAPELDYVTQLANGVIDLAFGNWLEPPESLHLGSLLEDEVVCLVSKDHPAVKRGWTPKAWLAADHIAPSAMVAGSSGVIDDHLARRGLRRNIVASCPHFSLMPRIVAGSNLVLTTGRMFCQQFLDPKQLAIVRCPVRFPALTYYQLWHQRSHHNPSQQWLRQQVRAVVDDLKKPRQV